MKRTIAVFTIIIAASVLLLNSCYYDNLEYLYPTLSSSCDTTNVTFSGSVTAMLQNYCVTCHSNSSAASFGGGYKLQDYADVSAMSDRIRGAINHESGYSAMPKNGGLLDACTIRQFNIWLAAGKPDN